MCLWWSMKKYPLVFLVCQLLYPIVYAQTTCVTQWSAFKRISGTGDDYSVKAANDLQGNRYVIGDFSNTATFDGESNTSLSVTSTGGYDLFVVKYDAQNRRLWVQTIGGDSQESGRGIHVRNGNVYITGSTRSREVNARYGGGPSLTGSNTGADALLICLNATNGRVVWGRAISGDLDQGGYGVTTDEVGDVFVAGAMEREAAAGGSTVSGSGYMANSGYVAKYRPDGTFVTIAAAYDIRQILAAGGWVYAIGKDSFFSRYDATTLAQGVSISGSGFGLGMALTQEGNIAVTGNSNDNIFIAEYNPAGVLLFTKSIGGTGKDYGSGITVDQNNNLYVTGSYSYSGGSFDFDGQRFSSGGGNNDVFIAKYKRNAINSIADKWLLEWVLSGNSTTTARNNNGGNDLVLNPNGSLTVVGTAATDLSIGPSTLALNQDQQRDGFMSDIAPGSVPKITLGRLPIFLCPTATLSIPFSVQCPPATPQTYVAYAYPLVFSGFGFTRGAKIEIARMNGTASQLVLSADLPAHNLSQGIYQLGVEYMQTIGSKPTLVQSRLSIFGLDNQSCPVIPPLCETIQGPGGVFTASGAGLLLYGPAGGCQTDSVFTCLSGGAAAQSQVVATAATTFNHAWLPATYAGPNPYEDGYAGKWRAKTTHAYNTSLTSEEGERDRNYVAGTFTATPFGWKSGGNPETWVPATTVTRYSANGEATEERDVLGNYCAAKFGYAGSVPYLVAQNAANNSVLFESFENSYGIARITLEDDVPLRGVVTANTPGATAHSGKKCLQMPNLLATRTFNINTKLREGGLWLKCWIRAGNGRQLDLAGMQQAANSLWWRLENIVVPVAVVAQTGEWALCETKIAPEQMLALPDRVTPTLQYNGNGFGNSLFIDDIRIQPADAQMVCYVYDESLRPVATFDDQHFGMYYQYNSEGKLVRKLIETERGIRTVQETQYNLPKVSRGQ